jgi:hypothetical protein
MVRDFVAAGAFAVTVVGGALLFDAAAMFFTQRWESRS